MVREPTGAAHEQPSQRLAGLGQLIAAVRGSPIECFGTMDLLLRNERGEKRRIMQADQSVYLRPGRDRLPDPAGMVVGEHDFPDVVVEVDHTTDVRRGKLKLYEEWGFPEVWVEVPERRSPSRPSGRLPGLTIHLLDGGRYREDTESRAFPGWTADEIHVAMNESELSLATSEVLTRVGRVLGAREGTGPDDMPWLRAQREEGQAVGLAQGRTQGRAALLETLMQRILASQGRNRTGAPPRCLRPGRDHRRGGHRRPASERGRVRFQGATPESPPPAQVLARKFHRFTAADADLTVFAALNAARVLDVLSSTPARPDSRSPCENSHLRALASRIGEICGLARREHCRRPGFPPGTAARHVRGRTSAPRERGPAMRPGACADRVGLVESPR